MLAVIRIRGRVGVRNKISDTLRMLNLDKKHRCVIVPENPYYEGMIKKVKDYVTWGNISEDVLVELVKKRGRTKENKKIDEKVAEDVVKKLMNGTKLNKLGLKPYFRLSPPSKGFKGSIKQHYPKGALGNRKEKINELLKRMI